MANHLTFEVLSSLVESRASTAEEPRARRHLATCARCRSELEWLQRIVAVDASDDPFELSRDEANQASSRLRSRL